MNEESDTIHGQILMSTILRREGEGREGEGREGEGREGEGREYPILGEPVQ